MNRLKFIKHFLSLPFFLVCLNINAQELPEIQKFYPFDDSTSWVEIMTFKDMTDDLPNVEVSKVDSLGKTVIDSVISVYSGVYMNDMNADNVKDLLISFTSGARSNQTYHLYLVDTYHNDLIRVYDFEKIVNPELHKSMKVITELQFTNQNCYGFHRIADHQVISLDTMICENPDSTVWNDQTIEVMIELLDQKEEELVEQN